MLLSSSTLHSHTLFAHLLTHHPSLTHRYPSPLKLSPNSLYTPLYFTTTPSITPLLQIDMLPPSGFCIAESPFEFRALEVALEAICSFLDARTTELETSVYPALHELTLKICGRNLDRVRKLKSSMTRLTARVQKIKDELENLLDDDNDMAELYLSRKLAVATPVSRSGEGIKIERSRARSTSVSTNSGSKNDVAELEMLLEAYYMQIDGTMNKLTTLREYIHDTEAYINVQLDNHRNQLIKIEFLLSSGSLCLTVYSVVVGMLGTNLKYTWNNDHGYVFKWVVIVTSLMCALLHTFIVSYANRKGLAGS